MSAETMTLPIGAAATPPALTDTAQASSAIVLRDDDCEPRWTYTRSVDGHEGVEVCASSFAGSSRHANQDGAAILQLEYNELLVAVLDGVTHSRGGIAVETLRDKLLADLGRLVRAGHTEPLQVMHKLQAEAQAWLARVAPRALTGAAALLLRLAPDGRYSWASAGDVSLLHCRKGRAWMGRVRSIVPRQLNQPAVDPVSNTLLACLGQPRPLRVEAGTGCLGADEVLVLATDGAAVPDETLAGILVAYLGQRRTMSLEQLLRRIDRAAVLHQAGDDRTLVVAQRYGRSPK